MKHKMTDYELMIYLAFRYIIEDNFDVSKGVIDYILKKESWSLFFMKKIFEDIELHLITEKHYSDDLIYNLKRLETDFIKRIKDIKE